MTAEEFNEFLQEEIKRAKNIDEAIRAYAILEMTADALSQSMQKANLTLPLTKGSSLPLAKRFFMTTLIFSSNPLIDKFSEEVQKEIRIIYYTRVGSFLGDVLELGEIMGAGKEIQ